MAASKTSTMAAFFFFLHLRLSASLELKNLNLNPLPQPRSSSQWSEVELEADAEAQEADSFTVDLHHIDSLPSTATTAEELFSLRLKRDAHRVKSLSSLLTAATKPANSTRRPRPGKDFSSSIVSGLSQGSGEYFTRLGVGTPSKYMYMVLDTGSDVVWTRCLPCRRCYTQTDPIFDPTKSHSFSSIPCSSPHQHN